MINTENNPAQRPQPSCTGLLAIVPKTAVIYPAAFVMAVTMGQLTLGMVLYAQSVLHAGGVRVGILAGSWSFTYVFGCLIVRACFSRILPRHLIVGSAAGMALLSVIISRVVTYTTLLPLYATLGMVLSLFWPPMMGWLSTGLEGRDLGRTISRYNMTWCSGSVISPFVCGWLSAIDPRYPLIFAAGLLAFIVVYVLAVSRLFPAVTRDRCTGAAHDAAPGDVDRSCALRYPAWIGLFASFFGMGTVMAIFPLVALSQWGAGETLIGFIFTVRGIANVVGFVILGRIHAWHHRHSPMLAAQWVTVAIFIALGFAGSASLAAALLAIFGFVSAMSYVASFFHGTTGSLNRARRVAIHESVLAAGLVLGSVVGGWTFQWLNSTAVFTVTGLILAALTVLQAVVARQIGCKP